MTTLKYPFFSCKATIKVTRSMKTYSSYFSYYFHEFFHVFSFSASRFRLWSSSLAFRFCSRDGEFVASVRCHVEDGRFGSLQLQSSISRIDRVTRSPGTRIRLRIGVVRFLIRFLLSLSWLSSISFARTSIRGFSMFQASSKCPSFPADVILSFASFFSLHSLYLILSVILSLRGSILRFSRIFSIQYL